MLDVMDTLAFTVHAHTNGRDAAAAVEILFISMRADMFTSALA